MDFEIGPHTILLTVAGSRAYGIHRPDSDVDVKGVAIPPRRYFLGFAQKFEQCDDSGRLFFALPLLNDVERAASADTKLEGAIYELRKFMALAAENNPNILDALFCRDEEVRLITPLGEKLRAHRDMFLSARAKHTYSGYATAQLKRIKGHRKWLLEPPKSRPTRAEFGLPEHTLIPSDQLAAAAAKVQKRIDGWELDFTGMQPATGVELQARIAEELAEIRSAAGLGTVEELKWLAAARLVGLDENLVNVMQRERDYEAAARHYRQYEDWRKLRNVVRSALEADHGYDTKHAAHLVRLLRMGREILETGQVNVWRGGIDADELRAIRAGAWEYDRLVEWAEAEDRALQAIYESRAYVVPKAPDRVALDALCVELVEAFLGAS